MTTPPSKKPVMNIADVPLADRGNGRSFDCHDGEDA